MNQESLTLKRLPLRLISFTSVFLILVVISSLLWLSTRSATFFRADLKQAILNELVSVNPPGPGEKVDVMYILGGNKTSMKYKFETMSRFFHKGTCKRIWNLSRPGITEYSPSQKRNWTNDEWATMNIGKLGIPEQNVSHIEINEGFFGTFSEAKSISALIKEKKYKSILLIAQPYHTHRVKISFDDCLKGQNVSVYVQGSGEKILLRHLIFEFIKLKYYQYFLVNNRL